MLHKIKKALVICLVISIQTKANNYEIKTISDTNLTIKELYLEKLFSKKQSIKKATITSATIGATLFVGYLGFNHWKKSNSSTSKTTEEPSTGRTTQSSSDSSNHNSSLGMISKKSFYKGIKRGIMISIAGLVFQTQKELLGFAKNKFLDCFKKQEYLYFLSIAKNSISSLNQLENIFSIKNEKCFKEEVIDFVNYFKENIENLIAITTILSKNKVALISNPQILKNSQNRIKEKIQSFIIELKIILNNNDEIFFNENDAQKIHISFKELNNQIFRFIQLTNSMISDKQIPAGTVDSHEN